MQKIVTALKARIGVYEFIAFVSGFVLMAYELLASRLLAPSIGSSMYVWTSVIGVMIAALAVGYAAGGWLADKRVAKQDIAWLLLLSALAIICTLMSYEPLLFFISSLVPDQRAQGVLAAVTLFMPASFLLGMISPYLARLRVKSLTTTGRSVATLSALNSVGGISGTFCTGFIFFSLFGSREALGLLVVALVACSWLIMPRYRLRLRLIVLAVFAVILCLQYFTKTHAPGLVANIETPSAHYSVLAGTQNERDVRLLTTDPRGYQSAAYTDGSNELALGYARKMAEVVRVAPNKENILIIGGGAFSLPEYLAAKYPSSHIDVVEIDPHLSGIAQKYFGYTPLPNIAVHAQDARVFLQKAQPNTYDVLLVDAYSNDSAIPFSLATLEYTEQLKRVAAPKGTVIANLIGSTNSSCLPVLASLHKSYSHSFRKTHVVPLYPGADHVQNIIALYTNSSVDWAKGIGVNMPIDTKPATPLTDNYAPVEALWQQCREGSPS